MVTIPDVAKPSLPTLDRLNATVPPNTDPTKIATEWFQSFSSKAEAGDVAGVVSLFIDDCFWRDLLSLTWDFRTFHGLFEITQFLNDRLAAANLKGFQLEKADLQVLGPDLTWIQALYKFQIGEIGEGEGVFRLVPTSTGEWKAHTVFTNLQALKGHPEKVGHHRNAQAIHGNWAEERRKEQEFEDTDPYVLIVGGGQSAMAVAARLKYLDITCLAVEKHPRIGDEWRNRYDALCLHEPIWLYHMPYIQEVIFCISCLKFCLSYALFRFPESWPVWTPGQKMGDWLEFYATALELNVWTSSTATSVRLDPETKKWTVVVYRADKGVERTLHPVHVVIAGGFGGAMKIPDIPGKDVFEGQILHSSQFKKATDYPGKKVVVVGAGSSGHDISYDFASNGADVTMIQRSPIYIMTAQSAGRILSKGYYEGGPPTHISDRVRNSFPIAFTRVMMPRSVKAIAEADKELLDGLRKRGFMLTLGEEDTGHLLFSFSRLGGFHTDAGASQMIVDGRIKLKSKTEVQNFTKKGVKLTDGSELDADLVVLATGIGDPLEATRKLIGEELAAQIRPNWVLNKEFELGGLWRNDSGVDNLWNAFGGFSFIRFYSRHLALQIKAIKEGMYGSIYAL